MPKVAVPLSLLALVLAVVGLFAALDSGGAVDGGPESPASVPAARDDALLARISALEGENQELRERVVSLEMRPAPAPDRRALESDGVTRADLDALRAEVRGWLDDGFVPVASEDLEDKVLVALESIRQEEEFEQAVADHEKRSGYREERVEAWVDWLALDAAQTDRLNQLMQERDEAVERALQDWANGVDLGTVEERREAAEGRMISEISRMLTSEQAERMGQKFGDR